LAHRLRHVTQLASEKNPYTFALIATAESSMASAQIEIRQQECSGESTKRKG
jgi:hypothetical protein